MHKSVTETLASDRLQELKGAHHEMKQVYSRNSEVAGYVDDGRKLTIKADE